MIFLTFLSFSTLNLSLEALYFSVNFFPLVRICIGLNSSVGWGMGVLWLKLDVFRGRPLAKTLSGASLEYRILQLYSRDSGRRSAKLEFDVGQGTQDLGFRSEILINFSCTELDEA